MTGVLTLSKHSLSVTGMLAFAVSLAHGQSGNTPAASTPLTPPPAGITIELDGSSSPEGAVFQVGFLADSAPDHQQALYVPFRQHLEAVLQRPVELIGFRDSRGLMLAMQRADIQYAMAPGTVFAATHRLCACVVPLATQPNRDGAIGLYSVLISDTNGSIADMDDLEEARLIIVGEGSAMAHRIGLSELWRAEVRFPEDAIQFRPTLGAAVATLQAGEADAVLSWTRQSEGSLLFDQEPAAELDEDSRASLRIIWRSRPVTGHSHFAHDALDEGTLTTLRSMLVRLDGTDGDAFDAIDRGSGRGFVERQLDDYHVVLDAFDYWDQATR